MTIQEQIYNRFTAAVCRLKDLQKVNDDLHAELAAKYLNDKKVSGGVQFSIKLTEQEFLVQTAILTALMEASETWQQFIDLHKKQTKAKKETIKQSQDPTVDFDAVLKGILNVPPPKKKQ